MGGREAMEVAKTVIEVADVAWTAMEFSHHYNHHHRHDDENQEVLKCASIDEELLSLRSENQRLRNLLDQNLRLLQNFSESPALLNDCPPDLYARLLAAVDSENFFTRLKSLQEASVNSTIIHFPFKEATGNDLHSAEILVNIDQEEPSWWVWVREEMVPSNVEEQSGIDNESYVVVTEQHVIDGVASFMAKCIISNPKSQKLTPEELQKTLAKALGGSSMSKLEKMFDIWHAGMLFYTLSTWGLACAGLYHSRMVLKRAAIGVHTTSKVVLKALGGWPHHCN